MNRRIANRIAAAGISTGVGLLLFSSQPALAASGGDTNRGDVWVDTVGAPPGPGHEMDPHLPCADINLWGDKLADPSGTYTIDSWPPSGSQTQAYSSSWSYSGSGDQVISVIDVQTLIANAQAAGAAPVNKNGFHFKLEFSQDPQKHKTFWVACTGSSGGGGGAGGTPPPSATPTPTGGGAGGATPTPSPAGTPTPSATPTPTSGIGGVTATPTPTPTGGTLGLGTGASPSASTTAAGGVQAAVASGVQGASATAPVTGAAVLSGLALALILVGLALAGLSRIRRTA